MVGWLVPQGHALLLQLFQPLAVDLDSAGAGLRNGVIPEHPAHVVEQPGHCQHRRGRTDFLSLPTWQTTPPLLRVCCVIHIPPLPSSVNYLFRLLPVSIKRDRAPGSTVRDGRTFRADCRMAESAHAFIDTLSKAIWIRRRGYRAVPNQGQPHPGEIVLLLLLRKNRFLMRLSGFGVCDGRSVPRTGPQRQGRSSPTPARRRAGSCQRNR